MVVVAQWYTTLSPSYLLQCQTRATTWLQISALHRAPGHVPLLHRTLGIYVCILYMYISTSVALPAGCTSLVCLCCWQLRRRTLPILVLNLMISRLRAPFPTIPIRGPVKSPAFGIGIKFRSTSVCVPRAFEEYMSLIKSNCVSWKIHVYVCRIIAFNKKVVLCGNSKYYIGS